MVEKLAKVAEKCAEKSRGSLCWPLTILHQPKMPKSMIKKDEE